MNDMVAEKLIQKNSNMLDEISEVNMLIRRLVPTQETLNRINERVDAVLSALKQLEKGVQLDETRLKQVEERTELLNDGLNSVKENVHTLVQSFKNSSEGLKNAMLRLEDKIDQMGKILQIFGKQCDGISGRLDKVNTEDERRWENNYRLIGRMRWGITAMWFVQIVTVATMVGIFLVLKFR